MSGMSTSRASLKKKGRLFLREHGDCFLHVTRGWLSYWPVSHSSENLMLVRVTLPEKRYFLTTLSPSPLSYGFVRSRERYLEIDTAFAKQLGISTPDIEVVVEVVGDIERCTNLCLEPVSPDDLEILEANHGKIEYELLSRIRVVSGQSFTFPIWIDNTVVPVRVVSSVPAATWVLLGSEETGSRGERATAVTFRGTPSPSSSSSNSYTSPTGSVNSADPTQPPFSKFDSGRRDLLCAAGLGSGSEASSPESEIDIGGGASSTSSRLFDLFIRPLLTATNSLQSENTGGERFGTSTLEPSISPPGTFSKSQSSHKHRRSSSDSVVRVKLPKYIETPDMDAVLRVQPHSIGGPDKYSMGDRGLCTSSAPQWEYSRVFDVYVHPSTFPEISNYYHCSKQLGSFLVQVRPMNVLKSVSQSQGAQNEPRPPQSASSDATTVTDADSVSSPVSDTKLDISRIFATIAEWSSPSSLDPQSDASSDGGSSIRSTTPQSLTFASSLVLRLCFATELVSCKDRRVRPLPHPPLNSNPEDLAENQEELKIAPGHIVMSHIVQQQLQIGACSLVRVSHVVEEGRLPTTRGLVTVHIRSLDEKPSFFLELQQKLESSLKSWVMQVCEDNPFGAVLVSNQILPLLGLKDNCCYCSLDVVARNLKAGGSHRQPLHYVVLTPQDLSSGRARVKIMVEKSQPRSSNELSIPSLDKLNPAPITLNPRHFGAFDELIERGSVSLCSALLQSHSHKPKGRLLISGSTRDAGLSCGKTSLAQLIVKNFTAYPTYAHVQVVDCTSLRVQTAVRVGKRLKEIFETALNCHPAVVVLDNLHNAMPRFLDVEEQTSSEGLLSMKKSQVLLDQLSVVDQSAAQVVVIATTRCREDLHPMLLQSRGSHVFEDILEIQPPDLDGRESVLRAVMESRAVHLDAGLRQITMRTEGFQVGDLSSVVDRAISCAQIRHTCPDARLATLAPPVRRQHSQVSFSFSFDDVDGNTSPLMTRSLPSSPLKKRRRLKNAKSLSPPLNKSSRINLSLLTLVDKTQIHTEVGDRMKLTVHDFQVALDGYVPLTLRGSSLHSTGTIDFSRVGGMNEIKKILRETILWPSKYPKLFSQCAIRMCRGVLLYGLPGTGKTLLAGSIAKEFGLNFISVKGPEILSKYIGASEQAVRELFVRAQAAKPCVLFFDEFDSLAPKRGQDRTGVTDRVVNQLLTQLDGVESLEGVYMVAASSRPDLIDPALLRPGRIDKSLLCDHPKEEERLDILKALSKDMSLESTADLRRVARSTENYTGADLKAVLYSAQLRAAHRVLREEKADITTSTENSDSRSKEAVGKGSATARVMVFRLSGPRCSELEGKPDLELRAVTLQKVSREKTEMATLKQDIHGGGEKRRLCITQEDLTVALEDVKPSVSLEERQRFTEIYDRFTGKIPQTLKDVINQRATMA